MIYRIDIHTWVEEDERAPHRLNTPDTIESYLIHDVAGMSGAMAQARSRLKYHGIPAAVAVVTPCVLVAQEEES